MLVLLPYNSILFPYTTLFRSRLQSRDSPSYIESIWGLYFWVAAFRFTLSVGVNSPDSSEKSRSRMVKRLTILDRKSTRLNSSHLGISYAVFCLNKKNNYMIYI